MKKKYKIILLLIAFLIFVTLGVSYAYYTSSIRTSGKGNKVEQQTAQVGDITIHVVGNLDDGTHEIEKDILPGHKSVGYLDVYATINENAEDTLVSYNLIWEGTNNLSIPLKYTVYKTTDSNAKINVNCTKKADTVGSETRYSEECILSSDNIDLNNPYDQDEENLIPVSEVDDDNNPIKENIELVNNESIKATKDGEHVYYIVVIEYENKDENQWQDISSDDSIKGLNGVVKVAPLLENADDNTKFKDYILAKTSLQTDEPDFSKTSCSSGCEEQTVGLYECIIKEDGQCAKYDQNRNPIDDEGNILDTANLEKTYYYRGDVEDNYVEFAGFYWRIIRINENGSLRMIYSGEIPYVNLTGKEKVLANGYDDSKNLYTQIKTIRFNTPFTVDFLKSNAKSTVLEHVLEPWYHSNIINRKYAIYIDTESGFCGDRTAYADNSGEIEGPAADGDIYFGTHIRLRKDLPILTFNCKNNLDLYTVDNIINLGNEVLNYPIGLISADEVAFAGGVYGASSSHYNKGFYLYTGYGYWTLSPSNYNDTYGGYMVFVHNYGSIYSRILNDSHYSNGDPGEGVRPVVNISPDKLTISGDGTINSPYTFQ